MPWLDLQALQRRLAPIAAEAARPPVDAILGWQNGLTVIEPGADGAEVDLPALAEAVAAAAASAERHVTAPLIATMPTIDGRRLDRFGIVGRLAAGSSSFAGSSEERATNVQVAATHLTHTLIPPGGTFSFNQALGAISPDRGYVEGKIIAGDWFASDLGGGVCQVSTTAFRAALLAGLPFGEWHPHSFRLGFYELDGWELGMDAAIYQPNSPDEAELDLRFANPTEAWMLLELTIDGAAVRADLYGTPTGYDVEIDGPTLGDPIPPPAPIVQRSTTLPAGASENAARAIPGVEAHMTRRVFKNGELLSGARFVSRYQPQPALRLVGPKRPSG